jgi:hypothetical protein
MTTKKQRPAGKGEAKKSAIAGGSSSRAKSSTGKTASPSPRLRELRAAMRLIREHGVPQARLLMSRAEYETAIDAIREAVAQARQVGRGRLPVTLSYAGGVFRLAYSTLGRVAICDHSGNRLLWSNYGALD